MKKILIFPMIIIMLLGFTGCKDSVTKLSHDIFKKGEGKNGSEGTYNVKDDNPKLSDFLTKGNSLKMFKDDLPKEFKNETKEKEEINGGYVYITKDVKEARGFNEQVVFTKSDVIYPGAIFRGDALLKNEYIPINLPRKPIDISISLNGDVKLDGKIKNPRVISSARETINQLINQDGLEGPAALSFSVSEVNSANQFAMELGVGIGIKDVELGFGISPSSDFEKSRKFAQFTQRYYSIGVDRPQYPSGFFDSSVTKDQMTESTNGYMPVYVSNVIYGRRGIFELETKYDSKSLESELSAGYAGWSGKIKDVVSNSIENSSMKLYILGGNGETAVQAIDSYDAFLDHIKEGGTYSPENRGEIIGFELRYLNDDSIAKTVVNEAYKVIEKVPRNRTISYDVDYIEATTETGSVNATVEDFSINMDKDSEPLWELSPQPIGHSIHVKSLSQVYINIQNNQRIPFEKLREERTVSGRGADRAVYYKWNPKQIEYSDPQNDKVVFNVALKGTTFINGKREFINIKNPIEFYIKDIEEDGVIVLKAYDEKLPLYTFNIGIDTKVLYDNQIEEKYVPVLETYLNGDNLTLRWSTYDSPEEPKCYVSLSKTNPKPSYPKDDSLRPDELKIDGEKKVTLRAGKRLFENGGGSSDKELISGEKYYAAVTAIYKNGKSWTSEPIEITIP